MTLAKWHLTQRREAKILGEARRLAAKMTDELSKTCVHPHHQFIIDGFVNKYFDSTDPIDHEALAHKAEAEWHEYDHNLKWNIFPGIGLIRDQLHSWLKDFKPSAQIEFTPGEHEIPARGAVSAEAKLARQWSVTHDAFDEFARVCYNTRWLRKCAIRRILNQNPEYCRSKLRADIAGEAKYHNCNWYQAKFRVFKRRLSEVTEIVWGSRFSTVPKNNTKRRPINIEPFGNLVLQRQIAMPLRKLLKRRLGNDLEIGQQIHKVRIKHPYLSTIDFSNASDSISLDLVEYLFPRSFVRHILRSRSPMVLLSHGYYPMRKVSAMGNGFTFELMTILLLATARVLDKHATVYGDDVIISNDAAPKFVEWCNNLGFRVNETKSFIASDFRESCGAFYSDLFGYIKRYDFHSIEKFQDVLIHANKALRLSQTGPEPLRNLFYEYWWNLVSILPPQVKGPEQPDLCDRYAEIPGWDFEHYDREYQTRYTYVYTLQWSPERRTPIKGILRHAPKTETVEKYRQFIGKHSGANILDQRIWYAKLASYLYYGRVVSDTFRGKGSWVYKRKRVYQHGLSAV